MPLLLTDLDVAISKHQALKIQQAVVLSVNLYTLS
jgi:hypothetical protein